MKTKLRRLDAWIGAAIVAAALVCVGSAASSTGNTIVTAAGNGVRDVPIDGGQATETALDQPRSVFATADGGYVWAQPFANTVLKAGPDGIITRIAGTGAPGYAGDGGPATSAALSGVHAAVPTADGGYLLADLANNRIRRIWPDGTITTVAGTGSKGFSGDGGPATAAKIRSPRGLAATSDGGFLIADTDNQRVRRVLPNGTITTVAGTGTAGYSGDNGPATQARLSTPFGVAETADGGFLIVDKGNQRVRKVAPDGTISTVAGTGLAGYSGDGVPATSARLNGPNNVTPTSDGGFFIADTSNHRVRYVDSSGVIQTFAGTGVGGFSGDGGPSSAAELQYPKSVGLTPAGDAFIADMSNDRIRFVGTPSAPANVSLPSISGPAMQTATLTGAAGGWSGTGSTFTREWRRCDSAGESCLAIAGATGERYVPTAADVGSTLRVQVTASNVAGTAQAESPPTAILTPAPGQPFFVASAWSAFNASSFTVPTPAGAQPGDVLLAWVVTDSPHAIGTVPPGWTQLGTTQNDGSDSSTSVFWRIVQPGDPASFTGALAASRPGSVGVLAYRGVDQGAPIDAFAQGSTPSASVNTSPTITPSGDGRMIVALFGIDPGQVLRTGSPDLSPVATERLESQNATWAVAYAEDNQQQSAAPVALDVTWNGLDTAASFIIALTSSSAPVAPSNTAPPVISGAAESGLTLSASSGGWSGSLPLSYAYQWRRCDAGGAGCADITGATSASYALVAADVGSTVRVAVTAANTAGSATSTSDATAVVAAGSTAPANTAPPVISGAAESGLTLSASSGSWSGSLPLSYAYQWRRCDTGGAGCADITDATGASYALAAADVGSTVRVTVTATNTAGSATATSDATAVVAAGGAGISFVSSTTTAYATSPTTTFMLAQPAGVAAGDLLLAWVATDSPHTIAAVPPGWTQLGTTQDNASDSSTSVFWRIVQPGDPTSWDGSFGTLEGGIVGVIAYRGVDQTAPIDTYAQLEASETTATITPSGNGRLIVALFGLDPNADPRTGTPDSSPPATERLDAQAGTLGLVYAEDYQQQTAAPVALDVTWNVAEAAASFVIALRAGSAAR